MADSKTIKPMNAKKKKQIQAAALELYEACYSILDSCEDMGMEDIGGLEDVRAALRACGDDVQDVEKSRNITRLI